MKTFFLILCILVAFYALVVYALDADPVLLALYLIGRIAALFGLLIIPGIVLGLGAITWRILAANARAD